MTEVLARRDRLAGVYVHVPFCAKVCPYCDFAVTARRDVPHDAYAAAVLGEWRARLGALEGRDVRTLYIGGGTPSRLSDRALAEIVCTILGDLGGGVAEVTLEANPVDVTPQRVEAWRSMGVTRVSLGVQSFSPEVLVSLGRNHTRDEALAALEALQGPEGLAVSADLIYGAPDQSVGSWGRDLRVLSGLTGLAHVSAYHLTVEARTPFARLQERGELELIGEDGAVEMLEGLETVCSGLGLERY